MAQLVNVAVIPADRQDRGEERRMKRVDSNHSEIVKGLRAVGATVRSTAMVGKGFPDIAVGFRRKTFLMEIKDGDKSPSARKLTIYEKHFHGTWQGQMCVVNSLDEALKAIGATE